MQRKQRVRRDRENGLAYLYLADISPGQAVRQKIVSLSGSGDAADLVLDFDDSAAGFSASSS